MIVPSTVILLVAVFAFLAMVVAIVLLVKTTRTVVDENATLTQKLLETPVDQIRKEVSAAGQPMKMDDESLMAWLDAKMEGTELYRQPDLDLKMAAETLGLSQRRIIKLLKAEPKYGSFVSYITEKRLHKACVLLKQHPEYTIESISEDAGFPSRRTFQTNFKARLGMSPSEYRRAAQNDSNQ